MKLYNYILIFLLGCGGPSLTFEEPVPPVEQLCGQIVSIEAILVSPDIFYSDRIKYKLNNCTWTVDWPYLYPPDHSHCMGEIQCLDYIPETFTCDRDE